MEIRWDWVVDHLDDIVLALWQHIVLTAVPLAIGFVISLGLAIWAIRKPLGLRAGDRGDRHPVHDPQPGGVRPRSSRSSGSRC